MRNNNNSTKRISVAFGIFMVVILAAGSIIPLLTPNTPVPQNLPDPTTAPTPTFPPPIANLSSITFDQYYLHPGGLFAVAQPDGWQPSAPLTEATRNGVTMLNPEALSVIEVSVEEARDVSTLDALDARYTSTYLDSSWSSYRDWTETERRRVDDRLQIDFNLELQNQTYIARQLSWLDEDWLYQARVVTPSNAPEQLIHVLSGVAGSIIPFKEFDGTPFAWTSYYDATLDHIIRFPADWQVTDSAPGRPASISGSLGERLRVEVEADAAIADEAAARDWVEAERPGAEVLSVQPVERGDASGFSVAYAFRTVDGETQSGLAVLLNSADSALHVANLRFPGEAVDLNAEAAPPAEATPEASATDEALVTEVPFTDVFDTTLTLAQVMQTFTVLPPLDIAVDMAATPTPLPEVAPLDIEIPTEAVTAEAAATESDAEAESTPDADATEAEPDEAETTRDAEATAEAQ
jgi:hypothetical protein